jgi:hypothetical protein
MFLESLIALQAISSSTEHTAEVIIKNVTDVELKQSSICAAVS